MCYPAPGPRCSNHAEKEYLDAQRTFARCDDPAMKLVYGAKLEEKQAVFETTPRGQNGLRRAADLAEGLEREELLLRMEKGKATRKQQLKDYHFAVENKSAKFNSMMEGKTYLNGRYQDACGVAALFLAERYPHEEFHIKDFSTCISDTRKVLILPEKYQKNWGECTYQNSIGYVTEDVLLQKAFRESLNVSHPSPRTEQLILTWFISKVKTEGYTDVISVNRITEDVIMVPVDKLGDLYSINLKLKKRSGGSAGFRGLITELTPLLAGTPFEEGNVLQPDKPYRTVIYGVPYQGQPLHVLNHELFLSWRNPLEGEEGYYEVRRRHLTANFNISVVLTAKKLLKVTGVAKSTPPVPVEEVNDNDITPEATVAPVEEVVYEEAVVEQEQPALVEPILVGTPDALSTEDEYSQDEFFSEDEYSQDEDVEISEGDEPSVSPSPSSNIWF